MWTSFSHSALLAPVNQKMVGLKIAGMLCAWTSIVLELMSTASSYWIQSHDSKLSGHSGLWKNCTLDTCLDIAPGTGYIDATRTFLIISTMAGMVAGLASFSFLNDHARAQVTGALVASVSSCVGAACNLIAMTVFTMRTSQHKHSTPTFSYAWCFFLGWAALPFFAISSVCYIILHRKGTLLYVHESMTDANSNMVIGRCTAGQHTQHKTPTRFF